MCHNPCSDVLLPPPLHQHSRYGLCVESTSLRKRSPSLFTYPPYKCSPTSAPDRSSITIIFAPTSTTTNITTTPHFPSTSTNYSQNAETLPSHRLVPEILFRSSYPPSPNHCRHRSTKTTPQSQAEPQAPPSGRDSPPADSSTAHCRSVRRSG